MAETYSLKATGQRADSDYAVSNVKVGDSVSQSWGDQQNAMQNNMQVLCKNPDGSQSWYTIDAERSTPSAIVLKAV